jgi:signal transduction histidine kinase
LAPARPSRPPASAAASRSPASRSPASLAGARSERPRLLSTQLWLLCWIPIAVIGVLHYTTHADSVWAHNVLRRVYYLPIVFAAFQAGVRGGLVAALVVSLTYLPHAFFHLGHVAIHFHMDPGDAVDKGLEVLLYNALGLVAGVLADRDRAQRRELQAALDEQRRLQKNLVRAGRLSALGEVVAGIAHEIKNPIHSLKGTAEIVDTAVPKDSEERRMWELHLSELDRLGRVAERFLSFSNPHEPELVVLDLRQVAQRLAELIGADARKRGVKLELCLGPDPVLVRGDRDQLAQVALNIALNAMRAIGDQGGVLRVTVDAAGAGAAGESSMAVLRLENDGPPIPEHEIEHLFDPFHSGSPDGTGLGLSISERILEQHGGYIEAHNRGLGVEFCVHVPAVHPGHGPFKRDRPRA